MAVTVKSQREIELMREAGKILAEVLDELAASLRPGISTLELDRIGEKLIRERDCVPSFKNFEGYPASICVSVNEEVVHGIPRKDHMIKDGDIVSLDCGLIYKGYQSDTARTYPVGKISPEAQQLIDVTRQSFFEGLRYARPGYHVNDISSAVQAYVDRFGYGIVRDLVGHGIGTGMHEDPEIPNFAVKRKGVLLRPGMTFCIEPMINMGRPDVDWLDDNWTVVTEDGSLSAHYENTVLITEGDPEILTLQKGEEVPAGIS